MENHLLQRKGSLETKIPGIKKSLDMVRFLKTRQDSEEPVETQFELADTLWATAKIPATKSVNLWLGVRLFT